MSSDARKTSRKPEAFLRRGKSQWYWMPASVLALGIASLLMLLGTNRIYERVIQRDQARVSAIEEIQLALATAHLWLEEYVTGDRVDLGAIESRLDRAGALADEMLGERRGPSIIQLEEPELRERALHLRGHVVEFHQISQRREVGFARGEPVGVGSAFDVEYDAVFGEALDEARALEAVLEQRQLRNRGRAQLLFRSILAAWVLIVTLAVFGLWTREIRRLRAEAALDESRAQLLQAQKMDAVGRLAGGIAHDINNYLGAIRAQSELVQMKAANTDGVSKRMDTIIAVVGKASSLIERLLAFSRQEPIQPAVVDLNRVVSEGVGPMVRRLVGEDVRLETHLEPGLWNVKIDPSQIEQVVVNLVVNAREAMPTGGSVAISTANRRTEADEIGALGLKKPGEYVVLSVADNGPGIPEEIRERVFEPFFTTKPLSKSSGLGLSTVYGIVEQNHGAARIDCPEQGGTTFEVYLPRSRQEVTQQQETAPPPVQPLEISGTVLLVEDNDELRESMRAMIEALGFEVIAASGGDEALQFFEEVSDDVDLVVTDVVMPDMNGKELVDRLRGIREDFKVLYVSGYTDDIVLRHGIVEGEAAFLKKPFSADHLAGKIRELTNPSGG